MDKPARNPIAEPKWWENPVVLVCTLSITWILTVSILHLYGWGTPPPPPHDQSWVSSVGPQFGLCCCMIGTVGGWYRGHRKDLQRWGYTDR